ncbi:MAG: TonB C-terminal domain-containing protein [Candidatus Eisenbacteria bacterium]|nr:TonB C-terminal domain-containing protein [Candidatus Eisenbacteria bacterium]
MRGPVLGSACAHGVLIIVLFALHGSAPLVVPGPDVVQVALIAPESATRIERAPAPPPRPRAQPAVKPESGEGVKLTPPRPAKGEPHEAPAAEPVTAPALPFARVGNAGLSGQVAVDSRDFEFTYYLMLVRNRIAQNWAPPAGIGAGENLRAVAYFQIGRSGEVRSLRLETPSGLEFFDRSVMRSVMLSDPLPPLPLGFGGPSLGVHFGFEWGGR